MPLFWISSIVLTILSISYLGKSDNEAIESKANRTTEEKPNPEDSDSKAVWNPETQKVKETQYPSIARIFNNITGEILCAATVITQTYLLTAAHCICYHDKNTQQIELLDSSVYEAVAGTVFTKKYGVGAVSKEIEWWRIHALFSRDRSTNIPINDIGIVCLKEAFIINEYISPINMYSRDPEEMDLEYSYMIGNGTTCRVIGWGTSYCLWDSWRFGMISRVDPDDQLYTLEAKVLSPESCRSQLCSYSRFLCKRFSTDVCVLSVQKYKGNAFGDDGSPLICKDRLWGIGSWASKSSSSYPEIYAHYSMILDMLDYSSVNVSEPNVATSFRLKSKTNLSTNFSQLVIIFLIQMSVFK